MSKVTKDKVKGDFAFGRINYILMLSGIGLILLGFILMSGGGSDDPNVFNPEIFSARRITLAPILVMAGFALEIYAIVKKAKD
jgi:membrane-bound ClpP family serine protease